MIFEVELLGVPVHDYRALEAHHDAMLREIALLEHDASSAPRRIVDLSEELKRRTPSVRDTMGAALAQAGQSGEQHVDIAFTITDAQLDDAEAAVGILEELDEFCRTGAMLTMPTPPHLAALRRWVVMDVSAQARRGARPTRAHMETAAPHVVRTGPTAPPERFLRLLESLEGVVWEVDAATLAPLFVTDGAVELLRRPAAEAIDAPGPWVDAIDPSDRDRVVAWRTSAGGDDRSRPQSADYRVITGDGQVRWLRDRVAAVDVDGQRRLLGLSVDVTAEQLTLRRRDARARIATVLSTAASLRDGAEALLAAAAEGWGWEVAALWLVERDGIRGVRTWAAPGREHREFVEFTRERVFRSGVGLPGRVWETGAPAWIADFQVDDNFPRARIALASGLHSGAAAPIIVSDAVIGVIEFFAGPVRPREDATLDDLAGVAAQISLFIKRRRAEEELRFQKALLEWESEATLDAIVVVSDDGRVLSYNRRFAEMAELDPDTLDAGDAQVVLERAVEILADPARFAAFLGEARAADEPRRTELPLRDGRIVDCYVATLPAPTTGARARAWYFRDITDRKLAESELKRLAYTLQQSLLPPRSPEIPGLDVATRYRYAGAGFEVGGDFYDVFQTGNAWGAVIGDVCGKGVSAASLTALVRYSARAAAIHEVPPSDVVRVVNEAILREPGDDQISTIVYVRIDVDDERVAVTSAAGGHPLPIVVRADGSVEMLGQPGTLLGAFDDIDVVDVSTALDRGDALVLYTDGVTEARAGTEFFGTQRLVSMLEGAPAGSAEELVALIADAALDFQGGHPRDDIAVVVVRVP